MNSKNLMTTKEVATALNVSACTIRRMCKNGKLPCYLCGAGEQKPRYMVDPDEFELWLKSRKNQ